MQTARMIPKKKRKKKICICSSNILYVKNQIYSLAPCEPSPVKHAVSHPNPLEELLHPGESHLLRSMLFLGRNNIGSENLGVSEADITAPTFCNK